MQQDEWVLMPRQASLEMLAEIQLIPEFTGGALQARYAALIEAAPAAPAWAFTDEVKA